jgi:hypothetical protein
LKLAFPLNLSPYHHPSAEKTTTKLEHKIKRSRAIKGRPQAPLLLVPYSMLQKNKINTLV